MPEMVDTEAAKTALARAWADIRSNPRPPARMQDLIENVMAASNVTFKYILITAFLAKYVNPSVHARALQAGSSLPGAYDARSVCHHVVVGFEKSKGNLFGLSNEPFLNKPARHPEHRANNPQLRDKNLAERLHTVLQLAQRSSRDDVYLGLVHILRTGSQNAANEKQPESSSHGNLRKVVKFTEEFLQETDGGARLVAIWGAFTMLLSENGHIKVYSPSTPDLYAETAGDVEVYYDKKLISASECKQRPLTLDDVNHGIKKARKKELAEYNFVISCGAARGQEAAVSERVREKSERIDLSIIDIQTETRLLASMLNPIRRAIFGIVVVKLLRQMRKFESANAAAESWNRLTDRG